MSVKQKIKTVLLYTALGSPLVFMGGFVGWALPVLGGGFVQGVYRGIKEVNRDKDEKQAYVSLAYTEGRKLFNRQLHTALDIRNARNKTDITPKEMLALLDAERNKYISELPKNKDEWSKTDKEVIDYANGLIKIYAERTGQIAPQSQAHCMISRQTPMVLAITHHRAKMKQLG